MYLVLVLQVVIPGIWYLQRDLIGVLEPSPATLQRHYNEKISSVPKFAIILRRNKPYGA